MSFTLVYYYIPEDFDDQEMPNAFGINKNVNEVTLEDIRNGFPLEGVYHFRFKCLIKKIVVWMDMENERERVPHFQDKIIMKATRISWETGRESLGMRNQQERLLSFDKPQPTHTFDLI